MKSIILGILLGVAIITFVPAVRDSGKAPSVSQAPAPVAEPPSVSPSSLAARASSYRNPLGTHGGLGTASMTQSRDTGAASSQQVYTLESIHRIQAQHRDGQVVRLRMSRPEFITSQLDNGDCSVVFTDRDPGHGATIVFPAAGVQKFDLLHRRTLPGLTFYVSLDQGGYRAVGSDFNAASQSYTW